MNEAAATETNPDTVLFDNYRIYEHNVMRIHYTTYDVRRGQNVVNPSTSHHNIILLADPQDTPNISDHPFKYARILGVYHANIIYKGGTTVDYQPRRMEFLFVRWYQMLEAKEAGWNTRKLDCAHFPPMATDDAFGFIDPSDIIRACYVVPAFANGKVHKDGLGLSHFAQDFADWKVYYLNRRVLQPTIIFLTHVSPDLLTVT